MTDTVKKVKVTVLQGDEYDKWPPTGLLDFKDWVNETIELIPEEFRCSSSIEFGSEAEYDSYHATLEVYYYRPETEEELQARRDREHQHTQNVVAHELALLDALQRKYKKP